MAVYWYPGLYIWLYTGTRDPVLRTLDPVLRTLDPVLRTLASDPVYGTLGTWPDPVYGTLGTWPDPVYRTRQPYLTHLGPY